MKILVVGLLCMMAVRPAIAQQAPPPVDPLTVEVEAADADRFAAIFESANGRPTAQQLQRGYLDPGSYGLRVSHRIA